MVITPYIEGIVLFLSLGIYFTFYNSVGELASFRNLNFDWAISKSWDHHIPVVPLAIIPYLAAYFPPSIYTFWCLYQSPVRLGSLRRAFAVQAIMITAGYALFVAIPCGIQSICLEGRGQEGEGMLARLNRAVIHSGEP